MWVKCVNWCAYNMGYTVNMPVYVCVCLLLGNRALQWLKLGSWHLKLPGSPNCLFVLLFRLTPNESAKLHIAGLCEGKPQVVGGFPSQRAQSDESASMPWRAMVDINTNNRWSKTRNTEAYPSSGRQEGAQADGFKITHWPSGKSREPPGAIRTAYATDVLKPPADN